MTKIQELRKEYEKAFEGKRPFNGWTEEKLRQLIDEKVGESPTPPAHLPAEPAPPKDEKKEYPLPTNPMGEPTPVYIEGVPFAIIQNEYVPFEEAEKLYIKAKVKFYQAKLSELE